MAILYNCNYDGTMTFSDVSDVFALTANSDQSFVVPGDDTTNYQALFAYGSSTSNVIVRLNGVATIPANGTHTTAQYNEIRPEKRFVKGNDVIHFITPDAVAYVSVTLRQLN